MQKSSKKWQRIDVNVNFTATKQTVAHNGFQKIQPQRQHKPASHLKIPASISSKSAHSNLHFHSALSDRSANQHRTVAPSTDITAAPNFSFPSSISTAVQSTQCICKILSKPTDVSKPESTSAVLFQDERGLCYPIISPSQSNEAAEIPAAQFAPLCMISPEPHFDLAQLEQQQLLFSTLSALINDNRELFEYFVQFHAANYMQAGAPSVAGQVAPPIGAAAEPHTYTTQFDAAISDGAASSSSSSYFSSWQFCSSAADSRTSSDTPPLAAATAPPVLPPASPPSNYDKELGGLAHEFSSVCL